MLLRVFLSLIFIPIITLIIYVDFLYGLFLFLFVLLLSILSSKELYELLCKILLINGRRKKAYWFCLPGALLIIVYYINSFIQTRYLGILYIIGYTILLIFPIAFFCFRLKRFWVFFLSYIFTGISPLTILMLKQENHGEFFIYFLFLLAWLNDAGAYFIGTFFGKTRNIIKYSPTKSLEGYVGAFIISLAVAVGFKLIFKGSFPPDFIKTLLLALLILVFAPLGDIGESVIKRKASVKDSSHFLPVFGGVLDIFDSILMSAPFYYCLLLLL